MYWVLNALKIIGIRTAAFREAALTKNNSTWEGKGAAQSAKPL